MGKRAVLYARVSGDDRGNDGRNLKSQLDMCRNYAIANDWEIVAELAEDDGGASGASLDLPELTKAIDMAQANAFDILVVREIDRLSRRLAKQLIVEEEFKRRDVNLEYVLGDYPDTPEGSLMKNVRAVIAEYERLKIIERTTRGRRLKVKEGNVLTGGPPPYGYRPVESNGIKTLEIAETEASVVRLIFEWYTDINRPSLRNIVKRLDGLNYPTPSDLHNVRRVKKIRGFGQWSLSTISHFLRNETYAGRWHYGKRRKGVQNARDHLIKVEVPAIISEATWEKTQKRLEQNKADSPRNTRRHYLLRRRVICGNCGSKMVAQTYKPEAKKYSYYRCPARNDIAYARDCNLPQFRSDDVDFAIWQWIEWLMTDPNALRIGLDSYKIQRELNSVPLRKRLLTIEKSLEENQSKLNRLLDIYLADEITRDVFGANRKSLEKNIRDLEKERDSIRTKITEDELTEEQILTLRDFSERVSNGFDLARSDKSLQRTIIEALDVHVTLAVEENHKVMHVECVIGEEDLLFTNNPSGGVGPHRRPLLPCLQRLTLTICCLHSFVQFPR